MNADLPARRAAIREQLLADESLVAQRLVAHAGLLAVDREAILQRARALVARARDRRADRPLLDVFLQEFGLATSEGVALLSLAEALLRIPDQRTADNFIAEKLRSGSWEQHRTGSGTALVRTAAGALQLAEQSLALGGLVRRLGAPVVRVAVAQAMRLVGSEFVLGRTIEEALDRLDGESTASFDMLGEGARTAGDAQRYFEAYLHAIRTTAARGTGDVHTSHGVSVKLSALHPRYEHAQRERLQPQLLPSLLALAVEARAGGMHLTLDAEEASRLELSLDLFEALARAPQLAGWQGLGIALQCYSRRASAVLDWLIALAEDTDRRFMVRLVKGAYWDTEIKRAQELGLTSYPVFTRKATTDLSYLVCAHEALDHPTAIYPQFATHNAHSIAAVMQLAGANRDFEFQRLHGMGELLYDAAREEFADLPPVRVYAPVGAHRDLLAYLVRRLMENGANTSFINHFMDERIPLEQLIEDPVIQVRNRVADIAGIAPPTQLYASRQNSAGIDLSDPATTGPLLEALRLLATRQWHTAPGGTRPIRNPADPADIVGHAREANDVDCTLAVASASAAQPAWDRAGGEARARILELAAERFEAARDGFLSLLIREAGKTLGDAVAELRETVDYCRYYACQAREHFGAARPLAGPTGEKNLYSLHGRGAFVCISPWNFPLAIFTGQVAAALAAGNGVLAKPADQTPLIAAAAVRLLHDAGVPRELLQLLCGSGSTVGAALVADARIAGVAMTGSTATARTIAIALANGTGPIVPLIAETGGQNAMFVDSTAEPAQVVDDVLRSAFLSAGQRCSALRVLYLQEEIADGVIELLKGAMDELRIGNPAELATDVGPVIDEAARARLAAHIAELTSAGCLLHACLAPDACRSGTFVAPHLFAIDSVAQLTREHFGPLLHVIRFRLQDLDRHLAQLEATGYGLTLGVQSRLEAFTDQVFQGSRAGNTYVNRNMVGAVVGVQPFGGHGLSGTGPKAGGPLYVQRFAAERVLTINTAAAGGNVELLRGSGEAASGSATADGPDPDSRHSG